MFVKFKQATERQTCIRDVLGSNLGRDTDYPHGGF
jgi:hypothetical protein